LSIPNTIATVVSEPRRAPLWRSLLSWVFLVLFFLAAPLALVSGWARMTALDSVVYAQTVRGVANDPRVQDALATAVTTRLAAMLAGENPTATEAIRSRDAAETLGEATRRVVASATFRETWETANREAHRLLIAGLEQGSGQPMTLDLSPLADAIAREAAARGGDVPPELALDADDLRIELLDATTADRIRLAAARLEVAFWASLAVAVLSLVLSVGFAPDRLAALARAAFGLAVAMVTLIALMVATQAAVANAAAEGAGVVVGAIVEALSQGLRLSAIALALAGLVLAGVFSGLGSLRRSVMRRQPAG
jgi:hypothetical protein